MEGLSVLMPDENLCKATVKYQIKDGIARYLHFFDKRKTLTGGITFIILPIITIDKRLLAKRVGNLPRPLYEKIETGIALILL
jgi:hypothetical protein